jgi:hypothetical protein
MKSILDFSKAPKNLSAESNIEKREFQLSKLKAFAAKYTNFSCLIYGIRIKGAKLDYNS